MYVAFNNEKLDFIPSLTFVMGEWHVLNRVVLQAIKLCLY